MFIISGILVSSLLLVQVIAENGSSGGASSSSPSSSSDEAHTKANSSSPQTGSSGPPQYNSVEQAAMQAGNMQFGELTLIVLASVAAAFLLYRIAISTVRSARVLSCVESDRQTYWRQSVGWFAQIKRHLLYAPLFRTHHQAEMQLVKGWSLGVLPTRFQSLFLVLLIAMNIVYCVVGIEWNSAGSTVMLGHLRNRTGTIAVVNMIPLVLLAGRNNPLIPLLNIPYGSFNMVHRWLGRIVAAESVVHTSCFIASKVYTGGWGTVSQSFMAFGQVPQTGLIAFCGFIAIAITSIVVFRRAFYELWYHLHIVLAIVSTVGLWYHLNNLPQQMFIRAFIVGWALERAIRLLILIYRNVGAGGTQALVEYLPGDAVKVTLTPARPWNFRPGQHIFLTIPSIGLWTTHPFSLAWSASSSRPTITLLSNLDPEKATGIYKSNSFAKEAQVTISSPQSSTASFFDTATRPTVTAIVRRRTGFTQKLWARIRNTPARQFRARAFVEGPYTSTQPSLASYGTILLFAGGVGITHQIPYLRSLLEGYATATVACRRLLLVWAVQSPEHLEWIRPWMTKILAMEGRRQILTVQLYITRSSTSGMETIRSTSTSVHMFLGRPNVETIVAHESKNQVGAMAVSVCGPGALSDDVRQAVRARQGEASVDFVEQDFSW
ncbi:MAG: hypothetical protein GOMPHAMPRED_006666 [Gomphillus americanus]|uniref:ferric-chelate reductase (NADPH) n=1 Tax=Gomphillus americanus TaxID=1940652 RepID=A0A8H3FZ82_9LECA|nr:MAG: hypothetical protein GOMPHAMPRED_006666 [Gomphillus americanus]